MSTSENSQHSNSWNSRGCDSLTWFRRAGNSSENAALISTPTTNSPYYDFISFLEAAQKLKIDFLPITWHPDLDVVGKGGTAEILQSPINLQTSLAFKRRRRPQQSPSDERNPFQALVSEVCILGHPSIRSHANIIQLEGICWDIPSGVDKVWPVLVFERTQYGDLENFLNSDIGKTMCLEDRLKLCVDVALAIVTLHSCRERL